MLDRHFAGDVALAVMLAISIAALARPETVSAPHPSIATNGTTAGLVAPEERPVSLLR